MTVDRAFVRPKTRLGRAIDATGAQRAQPPAGEQHRRANSLRDVILGGQDGLVNILGIILGVIAGGGSTTVLIATGFAAAITESISMGAMGYTSTVAERDYYLAERLREIGEIESVPETERDEVRDIYAARASRATCSIGSSTRSPRTATRGSTR